MRYHQRLSKAQAASSCPVAALVFVMGRVGAADAFSLLCRAVSIVTEKYSVNGHTLPILLLLRVVMAQRNLAFTHTAADTLALATFMTTTFQTAKIEKTTEVLAKAYQVPVTALDLAARVRSRKHIMNQPADVNAELVKKALNPNRMQWSWVARNVLLRSSCTLGSPTAQVNCPAGLSIANVTAIKQAILELRTVNAPMPEGCTAVVGSGATEGDLCVDKIGWSWTNVHVEDPDFIIVRRLLEVRFLGGVSEKRSGGADAGSADDAAAAPPAAPATLPARGGRPPPAPLGKGSRSGTKYGRGTKRTDPEPVVPNPSSVRSLRHKKAAAKYAKSLDVAASILSEQEARATVVRPPFVLGRVNPFSKWPFGGVVVFVKFPFLVDPTWRKTVNWTAYCRKVLILKTGGRYEIVFRPKKVPSASSADGPNGTEPLLDNRDKTNAAFGAGMDASGAAAAGTDASGEGPSGGAESGTDPPSGGVGTGAAADGTHADASENDELGTPERIEESLLTGSCAGAASVGRSVSPSAAGGLVDGASTGAPVNSEAELAV